MKMAYIGNEWIHLAIIALTLANTDHLTQKLLNLYMHSLKTVNAHIRYHDWQD